MSSNLEGTQSHCRGQDVGKLVTHLEQNFDNSTIKKCNIDVSSLYTDNYLTDPAVAFTLENIFTANECQAMINLAEEQNFSAAPVNYGGVEMVDENLRSSTRVMIDDEEFVAELWNRISPFIPKKVKGAQAVGLNERLRFLKYNPNQFFGPHADGNYVRPDNQMEISLLTIQMYLNEEFDGGETTFLPSIFYSSSGPAKIPVKPKTGMALVFGQDLFHEGSTVKSGVKYTVRTDVMYRYGNNSS